MPSMPDIVRQVWGEPDKTVSGSGKIKAMYRCRLHRDTHPSFTVYEDGAKCFQCQQYFGPVGFLVRFASWPVRDALSYVAGDRFPMFKRKQGQTVHLPPLPPDPLWQEGMGKLVEGTNGDVGPARDELLSRGIGSDLWAKYDLGWNREWTKVGISQLKVDAWFAAGLVLPTYYTGSLWAVNIRTNTGKPKYMRVAGGSVRCPFGMGQLEYPGTLMIIEGELDALTAKAAVGPNADVLGLRGIGDSLKGWDHVLASYDRVILCLNGDEPGQVAAEELIKEHSLWINRKPPDFADDLGKMVKDGWDLEEVKGFLLRGEEVMGL